MDDTIIMDSVIQKYFAGETSEQEEKYLLAWLEESEEHRKYFFELKSLWGARRVFEESTDLSRFASFMRSTDHRIGSIVAGERSTRRRRLVRWTLGAAAAVLLAVCAGTAWHFLSTPDIYRVYENTGDAVTTVTLDDGTHVWLNARTKLTLPEAFGPTQRQRLAGAHGDQVALDFGHEPEREAEHLAVDRVVEGVLLLGGVQVDSALEAFAHDSHDVGERPAQAGYFRHDQRVSPLHALQQPSELAVLLFRLAADYLGHPVGYHQLPAFGETSDFVLLIGQILFARTDP